MKDVTREKVINALMELIYQKDYEKITVTDITRKAGISRMSFYRNYKNVNEILFEVIDREFDDFHKRLDEFKGMDLDTFMSSYFERLKGTKKLLEAAKKSGSYERLFQIILKYNRLMMEKYLGRTELTDKEMLFLHYHSGGMYEMIKFCSDSNFVIPISETLEVLKNSCPFER